MLISDLLAQATVTYGNGDLLAANTASVGYVPSILGTDSFGKGLYNFKIKGIGTADGSGNYAEYHIVPVVVSADGLSFVDDDKNPIIVQKAGTVMYATGRNDVDFRDVYHDRSFNVINNITAGQEARTAINCFVEFVKSEYSLGVNDFTISGPTYTDK